MAIISNQPSSSAASEADEGKQEKGLIGPGEVDQNVKGEGVLSSDSPDSEQGKKNEEKYLPSRAVSEWTEAEQDKYFMEGLDPDKVSRVAEENKKSNMSQPKGGLDVKMGDAEEAGVGLHRS